MRSGRVKKIDAMIVATFLSTIFYSSAYPHIHQIVVTQLPPEAISYNQIINCIALIVTCAVWNKYSDKLFKYYNLFCTLETASYILIVTYAIRTGNLYGYYMLDTFDFAIITNNIIRGGTKLKAILYNTEKKRERFDNNNCIASSLATLLGSGISLILRLDINALLIISAVGGCIDNVIYMGIFTKNRRCNHGTEDSNHKNQV